MLDFLNLGLAFAEGFVEVLVFMILALSAVSGTATTIFPRQSLKIFTFRVKLYDSIFFSYRQIKIT